MHKVRKHSQCSTQIPLASEGLSSCLKAAARLYRALLTSSSLCSVVADTVDAAVTEIREAAEFGADVVELRLDFLKDIDLLEPKATLKRLLGACDAYKLPAIVTFRPAWEGYASVDHLFVHETLLCLATESSGCLQQ